MEPRSSDSGSSTCPRAAPATTTHCLAQTSATTTLLQLGGRITPPSCTSKLPCQSVFWERLLNGSGSSSSSSSIDRSCGSRDLDISMSHKQRGSLSANQLVRRIPRISGRIQSICRGSGRIIASHRQPSQLRPPRRSHLLKGDSGRTTACCLIPSPEASTCR